MMNRNYVGVSGVKDGWQAAKIAAHYRQQPYAEDYRLMLGFTLAAEAVLRPNLGCHPVHELTSFEQLRSALNDDLPAGVARIAQVRYHDEETLCEALRHLARLGNLDGIQLAGAHWPTPELLTDYRAEAVAHRPDREPWLILELGAELMQRLLPSQLIGRLDRYEDVCPTHVLMAWSGARGSELEAEDYLPVMEALSDAMPDVGQCVAGRLCAEEIWRIGLITDLLPFSVDARDRLQGPTGELSLERSEEYLSGLSPVLCGAEMAA